MSFHRLCVVVLFSAALLMTGCGRQVFTGKHEARGVWMSRFEYTSERLRSNPEAAKARIRAVFEKARAARMNMIIFQVRGNGDAFYRSSVEPWSNLLTDTLGKDPGWDPLAFAIDEAHRLGLELHAWVNAFPFWRGGEPPTPSDPPNPYYAHPEWTVCDKDGKPMTWDPPNNNYISASPGIPAVRNHILSVVKDIITKYDVDGIHFDYIRYPEGSPTHGYSHDSTSVARFNSAEGNPDRLDWDNWQREQINRFVFDAYNLLTETKPWVKMSASVIGKYTGPGWTGYNIVYQDARRWMQASKIDFIVPMIYHERSHPTHPFIPLITDWHDRASYQRFVYPGLAARMADRFGWGEVEAQVDAVRDHGLPGLVFFSAGGLEQTWDMLGGRSFPYWANVPAMPWKPGTTPAAPGSCSASVVNGIATVSWQSGDSAHEYIFNVYRSAAPTIDPNDVFSILTITGRGAASHTDSTAGTSAWYYAVAAVDRAGRESELSPVFTARPLAAK